MTHTEIRNAWSRFSHFSLSLFVRSTPLPLYTCKFTLTPSRSNTYDLHTFTGIAYSVTLYELHSIYANIYNKREAMKTSQLVCTTKNEHHPRCTRIRYALKFCVRIRAQYETQRPRVIFSCTNSHCLYKRKILRLISLASLNLTLLFTWELRHFHFEMRNLLTFYLLLLNVTGKRTSHHWHHWCNRKVFQPLTVLLTDFTSHGA